MSRKNFIIEPAPVVYQVDPLECPFREFRDNEISADVWGMSTGAFRAFQAHAKSDSVPRASTLSAKGTGAHSKSALARLGSALPSLWIDEQIQPLPRSTRQHLYGWIRAEDLAMARWAAEVTVYDEVDLASKMSREVVQLCHAQVLYGSSFCRKVLSACYALENIESITVEHQWELFTCALGPEGWRAKCHIYSPGLKAGGGLQHRPTLSKNGCYLVRLFYLGAWRCVWVNDEIPVDTSGAPLLPFAPLLIHPPPKPGSTKLPPAVPARVIHLWPLLLTKALLKLAAPDMNFDEGTADVNDEEFPDFDILHALLGTVNILYPTPETSDEFWANITAEVPVFSWENEEDTSTIKSRSTKRTTAKELAAVVKQRNNITYAVIEDTKNFQPFILPGITPAYEMGLYVMMARDVPIKKPLPEPEVALWKYYRWVDWAKKHGLYSAYDCPRDKFLKVNGLLKSSYAPHLLDVPSTESITKGFIQEQGVSVTQDGENALKKKKTPRSQPVIQALTQQQKAEFREWISLDAIHDLLKYYQVVFFPSLYKFTSAGSNPPIRINLKATAAKITDIAAPKNAPLYLQLDGPDVNTLRVCLTTLHPRVLTNSGNPVDKYVEPAHLVLEEFEWFKDTAMPIQKAFMTSRGYESLEIKIDPGRHFFRIWTHYQLNWHMMLISESSLVLNTRDVVLGAAVHECPWVSRFLLNLGSSFSNWIKISRASPNTIITDREFFSSYLPDLTWDKDVVGYDRHLVHWMFRKALQAHLSKVMNQTELKAVSHVLRKYFCDPDFGFFKKPRPLKSFREMTDLELCDCLMPDARENEVESFEDQENKDEVTFVGNFEQFSEEAKHSVPPEVMNKLLEAPKPPVTSQICEMATDWLPCAILKEEREKLIQKHEAATVLQAYWRGTWARRALKPNISFSSDVTKLVHDRAFGSLEVLSKLMNEFFFMYPGARYAYSVGSALNGARGLQQHSGVITVTDKCKWIPLFQGVFYCHALVKVHFDIQSSILHSTMAVYNNDTGQQLPQVFNSHITFDFAPNILGYTVIGHGTLTEVSRTYYDAQWQLTIMSCLRDVFHVCDNEVYCKELPLPSSRKLHSEEVFVPNRRNILGGLKILVSRDEAVSFRAAASSPDLEMVATLRALLPDGRSEDISTCSGIGEIYWPYIRLTASTSRKRQPSQASFTSRSIGKIGKSPKVTHVQPKNRSSSKIKINAQDADIYSIEVTCPMGWPLTIEQWRRVNEVRNTHEPFETFSQKKASTTLKEKDKGKPGTAKDKLEKPAQVLRVTQRPLLGDACVELECASAVGGEVIVSRDDERDLEFLSARKCWAQIDSGRNHTGSLIRKQFRAENLVTPPLLSGSFTNVSGSGQSRSNVVLEGPAIFEIESEESKAAYFPRPHSVSVTEVFEMSMELEEDYLYLLMPDLLRDQFIPLDFIPLCTKEKNEEKCILVSSDMAEAAKNERHARINGALERMHELEKFNEEHVLGRQKARAKLLEMLYVDDSFTPDVLEMMAVKEAAVAKEVNLRTLSATKKKVESKKK